jgi:hypothetical protein
LATPGSLEYLRSYGFQTFAGLIDESYDTVQDPVDRLKAVVTVMKTILQMPLDQKHRLLTQMNIIAEYNKQRFFGEEFTNSIIDEFKQNFDQAVDEASKYRTGKYFKLWKQSQIVSDVMPLTTDEITYIESNLSS